MAARSMQAGYIFASHNLLPFKLDDRFDMAQRSKRDFVICNAATNNLEAATQLTDNENKS